jgi:sec-independent protein translocase protein TatC
MVVGSSTIAILILATVTFFVSDYIFDVIIFGPTNANFVTSVFFVTCLINWVSQSICVTDMFIIQNTNMEAKLMF